MASPERYVVGLDISESALEKAAEVNHFLTILCFVFSYWEKLLNASGLHIDLRLLTEGQVLYVREGRLLHMAS